MIPANKAKSQTITVDIKNCSRCGKSHDAFVAVKLESPSAYGQYWGFCPKTKEPLFVVSDWQPISGQKRQQLDLLKQIARPAWIGTAAPDDAPTAEDLVTCLTNVACNRYKRIRELEQHLKTLLKFDRPQ